MSTRLAINGAAGRMGVRLVALAHNDPELQVAACLESPQHPRIGEDAGEIAGIGNLGIALASSLEAEVEVVIDFSVPSAAATATQACMDRNIALVMATTGLDAAQKKAIESAASHIAVVWAPNMSLAVNLTMKLAEVTGRALRDHATGTDVEIIERHHRFKEDAPSGTALRFGQIVADAMGQTHHIHGRHGRPGPRAQDEIGYHALRVGDNPGEHTIVFGLLGEKIELTVGSTSRDCYAQGALTAAKFVVRQSPGLYSMQDVLQL